MSKISIQQAKQALIDGNNRFIQGKSLVNKFLPTGKEEIPKAQKPFAVILSCADSRVPVETIFDQSFGDLFIIRIAGNIVAPSQIGSVEFAVSSYNSPLVLVLGHSYCGAIIATIDKLKGKKIVSENIYSITKRIAPSVKLSMKKTLSENELINESIRANIKNSVNKLYKKSEILQQKVNSKQLIIIGAEYDLATGVVGFI